MPRLHIILCPTMKYFSFLIILTLLSSCSKPEENFIKIPSEFSINIQEEIQSSGMREVWLELSSLNAQYCQDDSLVYNTSIDSLSVFIEILDSYKANDCSQKNYYLNSRIKLPEFTDSLHIQLSLGSASTIHCTVYSFKNYYTIEINEGKGLIKKYEKTYKIPQNLIWGFAYPKSIGPNGENAMINFKKDIEFDCNNYHLPKGYYTYFSVEDNNVLILSESPGIAGNYLNFYFSHSKTKEELIAFFDLLASEYVDLVGYKVTSGFGIEFKSN